MAAEKEKKRRDPEKEWPFWDRVEKTEGCWLWKGAHRSGGYGSVIRNGRQVYAHRFAFEQTAGAIPEGYQVHHRCGNKLCVRPDHLELLTPPDHARLDAVVGWNWGISHCRRGHEFTPENTAITSQGSRSCRKCQRTYSREWKKRKREGLSTRSNGLSLPKAPRDPEREWPFWSADPEPPAFCKRGHPRTPETVNPLNHCCRLCQKELNRARYLRRKESESA